MSRLCGLVMLVGISLGLGEPVQAGGTPSAFDPVFSPVSYRQYTPYYTGYTPYYAGYSGYYGIPYASSYSPGCGCSSCGYGCSTCGYGCSSCGSCGYGCASCGTGCASGNCATGNCATTTNLAPNQPLAPIPDPSLNSQIDTRSFERRLERIERELNIPTTTAPNNRKTFEDNFNGTTNRGTTGFQEDRNRPRRGTGATTGDNFEQPQQNNQGMFEERTNRVNLGTPNDGKDAAKDEVIPSKGPAPSSTPIDDKSTTLKRMDTRVTSKAVSPRERNTRTAELAAIAPVDPQPVARQVAKPQIASRKTMGKMQLDAGTRTFDLARQ